MKYSAKLTKELKVFGYEPKELTKEGWEIFLNTFQNIIQNNPDDAKAVLYHLLRQEIKKIILILKGEINED